MAPILLQWEGILDLYFCCVVSGTVLAPVAFCQKISNGILKSPIPSYILTLDSANCFQWFSVRFQRRSFCCILQQPVCCGQIFVGPQLMCQRMREVMDHLMSVTMTRICSLFTCQYKRRSSLGSMTRFGAIFLWLLFLYFLVPLHQSKGQIPAAFLLP